MLGTAVYAFEGTGMILPVLNSLGPAARVVFPRLLSRGLGKPLDIIHDYSLYLFIYIYIYIYVYIVKSIRYICIGIYVFFICTYMYIP